MRSSLSRGVDMKVGGAVVELMMRSPGKGHLKVMVPIGWAGPRSGKLTTISLAEAAPTNERASEQQHKKEGAALSSVVSAQ
jgi:hypothetical protein